MVCEYQTNSQSYASCRIWVNMFRIECIRERHWQSYPARESRKSNCTPPACFVPRQLQPLRRGGHSGWNLNGSSFSGADLAG